MDRKQKEQITKLLNDKPEFAEELSKQYSFSKYIDGKDKETKIKYFSIQKTWEKVLYFGIGIAKGAIIFCVGKYTIVMGKHTINAIPSSH